MINNFEKIRNLLTFPTENSFYFLEIIKRRKENPDLDRHAKLVRDFYIYSLKEFNDLEGKIVDLCEENNARAYFRLNVRDSKKIAFQYVKRIAELLITEDYKAIPKSYASVVGEFHADKDKKWLIDLDLDENSTPEEFEREKMQIEGMIVALYNGVEHPLVAEIQTRNGVHLIVRPFRLDTFKNTFPNIEVHKDNPTILYIP